MAGEIIGAAFAFAGASAVTNLLTKAILGDGRRNLSDIISKRSKLLEKGMNTTLRVKRDLIISTKLFEIRIRPSRLSLILMTLC